MMENNTHDEQLLAAFFQEAREQAIADGGFTRRVMNRLPDRALQLSRLWTFFCLAVAGFLFVAGRGWQALLTMFEVALQTVPAEFNPQMFVVTVGVLLVLAVSEIVSRGVRLL